MPQKIAFITVHGMGSTPPDYDRELRADLSDRLGPRFQQIHHGAVYYQHILEPNERRVWDRVGAKVRWDELRQFLLYGFADAAGLEAAKEQPNSVYTRAQIEIARELARAYRAVGPQGALVLLAQSLGGQVSSCYFWDALRPVGHAAAGIWKDPARYQAQIFEGHPASEAAWAFVAGASLRHLVTTGCNIPIFVAAHAHDQIVPIRPKDPRFRWTNFYDKDDVLGWPLAPLSPAYGELVRDIPINAAGGVLGWITASWNPLSHTQYWRDDELLSPLTQLLEALLDE